MIDLDELRVIREQIQDSWERPDNVYGSRCQGCRVRTDVDNWTHKGTCGYVWSLQILDREIKEWEG